MAGSCLPQQLGAQDTKGREPRPDKTTAQIPAAPLKLPQGIALDRPLTEEDSVAIALWNNAALHLDLAALGVAKADLIDAGLLRNPTLQVLLPFGYTQFEMLLNLPAEVFWQRPRRVAAARIEVDRVAKGLEQNGLDLVRDVRIAFWEVILAKERVELGQEAVRLRRQILGLVEARLRAGDVSELEANAARMDLSTAEEQATRFEAERGIAHGRLRYLLGLEDDTLAFDVAPRTVSGAVDPMAASPPPSLESLQKAALGNRPDLRGAALAIESAAKRANWEHSKLFALGALLSIKQGAGLDFSPRGGLLMELPIFHRNKGGITRADAEVERAGLQYLAVHQRISHEVREALTQYQRATESLQQYRTRILPQAAEGVRLAEKGYKSGDQSYLFVLEATRRLLDARLREVELVNELRRSSVQLDRSVGRKRDAKS